MQKGPCDATQSILSNYMVVPPLLTMPRALHRGDLAIALASTMPLLASLLTVSTGALFTSTLRNQTMVLGATQEYTPYIDAEYSIPRYLIDPQGFSYDPVDSNAYIQSAIDGPSISFSRVLETYAFSIVDHLQSFKERLVHRNLPPFTSDEHFFLPVQLHDNDTLTNTYPQVGGQYFLEYRTIGFKANLSCVPLVKPQIDVRSTDYKGDKSRKLISLNITLAGYINSTKIPLRLGSTFWWSQADSSQSIGISPNSAFNNGTEDVPFDVDSGTYAWQYTPFLAAAVTVPNNNATASGPTLPKGPNYPMYEQYAQG